MGEVWSIILGGQSRPPLRERAEHRGASAKDLRWEVPVRSGTSREGPVEGRVNKGEATLER